MRVNAQWRGLKSGDLSPRPPEKLCPSCWYRSLEGLRGCRATPRRGVSSHFVGRTVTLLPRAFARPSDAGESPHRCALTSR